MIYHTHKIETVFILKLGSVNIPLYMEIDEYVYNYEVTAVNDINRSLTVAST